MSITPSHPAPSRRRPTGIRRPRVAGRVPGRVGPIDGPVTPRLDTPRPPAAPDEQATVALPATAPAALRDDTPPAVAGRRGRADRAADPDAVPTAADGDVADSAVPGRRRAGRGRTGGAAGRAASSAIPGRGRTSPTTTTTTASAVPDGDGVGRRRAGGGRIDRRVDAGSAPATDADPAGSGATGEDVAAAGWARPSGKRLPRRRSAEAAQARRRPRKPVPTPALAGALALLVGAAVFFGVGNTEVRGTASAQNTALVDVGATAKVSQQVTDALRTIYSFDYTRLDQNEVAARAVITPEFADRFDRLFQQVRQLAPQQQAVVTATVNLSAVKSINGDTATLLVFLDQQATRAQAGGAPQQLAAAGRLTVTAQLVDGTWKVAGVDPR